MTVQLENLRDYTKMLPELVGSFDKELNTTYKNMCFLLLRASSKQIG